MILQRSLRGHFYHIYKLHSCGQNSCIKLYTVSQDLQEYHSKENSIMDISIGLFNNWKQYH